MTPTGNCVVDMSSAEFQKSVDIGSVQLGQVTMRATMLVHNKWVPLDTLDEDPAILNGGTEASEFFARRSRDPARAKRLEEARNKLGVALDATYGRRAGLVGLRLKQGLSQAELARRLGTQQPSIARWERSPQSMSVENVSAMAGALGVDAIEVFTAIQQQREIEYSAVEHESA